MVDETFGIVIDWGLGFAIDTYITGRHSSTRAFGHGGHQSSAAFCDPEHGVVVAVVCNGMPGSGTASPAHGRDRDRRLRRRGHRIGVGSRPREAVSDDVAVSGRVSAAGQPARNASSG